MPYDRLRVAQLARKVEARRMALDEDKGRLLGVSTTNAAIDEIADAQARGRVIDNACRDFGKPNDPVA